MIGRRTTVGLSLLCALLFSAIAVQSASAAPATNTTAVTCVLGGGNEDFSDNHCDNFVGSGNGDYGHVDVEIDETTEFEGVQLSNAVLKSKAAGAAVEVTCTSVVAEGSLENVEPTAGEHQVTGTLETTFNSCTVNKPAKCVVAQPIVTNTEFEGVEGLAAGGMGVEHNPVGAGTTFVELTFENKGAEKCNIAGKFPVTGTAVQTGGTAAGPAAEHTGATGVFTQAMTEETLKFGPEKASFSTTATVKRVGGNPLALTTVT